MFCSDYNDFERIKRSVGKSNMLASLKRLGLRRLLQFIWHLPSFLKLFWRLIKDRRIALWPKVLLLLILAYVVSPIDLLPDLFVGIGQLDDLMVLFLGLQLFIRLCPSEIVQQHVRAIAEGG